ncbi:MAG: hypothetical protein PHH23_07300 [Paludibacteraceae bacterium]|nr:hypothetical protein [Paludibacteraceae bacterium]
MKLKSIYLCMALAILFAGCEQDGEYNPAKKIARIYKADRYQSGTSTPKHLSEVWNWDGNRLTSIDDYYYNSSTGKTTLSTTTRFVYDGKKVSRIYYGDNAETRITYNNDGYDKVTTYAEGALVYDFKYTYKGGKVVKVDLTYYGTYGVPAKTMPMLSFFVPQSMAQDVTDKVAFCAAASSAKAAQSSVSTWIYSFTYQGDNVSTMEYDEGTDGVRTFSFKYDTKNNPYYHSFQWIADPWPIPHSKNNVIEEARTNWDGEFVIDNYDYVYEGNWPIEERYAYRSGSYYSTSTTTTYYEYQ